MRQNQISKRLARVLSLGLGLAVVAGLGGTARAEFNIATGLKWVPVRYTQPITATGGGAGPGTMPSNTVRLYGWQTTSLDNYLALFFHEQIGIQLSLDFGYGNAHLDIGGTNGYDAAFTQFGFALGGKFYLNRPTRERVSPYLYVDFFKYFASVSTSEQISNDRVAMIGSLVSPIGLNIAFGAEYFFTTSFSLGAEVFGIRFAHVDGGFDTQTMAGRLNASSNYASLYTGLTLNYRFLATARVYTYEEEEDKKNPRPKRRNPVPPPPDNGDQGPPPPSPESVD
ncbi:MAG: hypothetical protein EXR72_12410 [Myxococcales bacterium]|nr:hypothetical protein [Myxococcales bacterium]